MFRIVTNYDLICEIDCFTDQREEIIVTEALKELMENKQKTCKKLSIRKTVKNLKFLLNCATFFNFKSNIACLIPILFFYPLFFF